MALKSYYSEKNKGNFLKKAFPSLFITCLLVTIILPILSNMMVGAKKNLMIFLRKSMPSPNIKMKKKKGDM